MLEPPAQQTREFTVSGVNAASAARTAFVEATAGWLPQASEFDARLLLSELVSAVCLEHEAPARISIRVTRHGEHGVRAEVDIPPRISRRTPRAFRLVAAHRAQILDALADRWGVVPAGATPYVWFELGAA